MKRATKVSIDSRLLQQARELGIDLWKSLEDERIQLAAGVRWRRANTKAIEAHNERVDKNGTFRDALRRF